MGHTFDELSGRVIEAAIDVHKTLGPGFLESLYEEALKIALEERGIAFASQVEIQVSYHDRAIGAHRLDLLVENALVVELKAIKALDDIHFAQVRSYLKATGAKVGLLLNFNAPTLTVKRVMM